MAKDKAKTEATKTDEKPKKQAPPKPEPPKYGVPQLAEALGIKATSARVQLRNAGIEKTGKVYGWNSKAEMQEVVDKLKASKSTRKSKSSDDDDDGDDD